MRYILGVLAKLMFNKVCGLDKDTWKKTCIPIPKYHIAFLKK